MILDFLYKLRTILFLIRANTKIRELYSFKYQRKNFDKLKNNFKNNYLRVIKESEKKFVISAWSEKNKRLNKAFLPYPPFFFLRNPIVMRTMFVTAGGSLLKNQIKYLEDKIPKKRLKQLLHEDLVGGPLLINSDYITSHNSIQHLYHLQRFIDSTAYKFSDFQTIVEWGGGYGNLAKIIERYNKNIKLTYILIDTSLFSCVQWLYLSAIFGSENVILITSAKDKIGKGKINVLPVTYLKYHKIKADLFISTWALSESSRYSQDRVTALNWFGAKGILLGFQKANDHFPYADNPGKILQDMGGNIEQIPFLPDNYYGFLYRSSVIKSSEI